MKFYSSIAAFYEDIFPLNEAQLTFIQNAFKHAQSKVKLLDVGCAVGTLVQELDKVYENVCAIDIDAEMIAMAKQRIFLNAPNIQIGNMLELQSTFANNEFDGIICFGNTLVHLSEISDIIEFLRQAYKLLTKGGKLMLQIINYDRILANNINYLPTIDNHRIKFMRDYVYSKTNETINFKTKLIIKENNQVIENQQVLIPINKETLVEMLKKVGFTSIKAFGTFKKDKLNDDSIPLIIEAVK